MSLHNSKETKAILDAAEALGSDTEWLRAGNTVLDIRKGAPTLRADLDVGVQRLLLSNEQQPAEGLGLAATLDSLVPMLDRPAATLTALQTVAAGGHATP